MKELKELPVGSQITTLAGKRGTIVEQQMTHIQFEGDDCLTVWPGDSVSYELVSLGKGIGGRHETDCTNPIAGKECADRGLSLEEMCSGCKEYWTRAAKLAGTSPEAYRKQFRKEVQ